MNIYGAAVYAGRVQGVIETPMYLRTAARLRLSQTERDEIVDHIARNPTAGQIMPGTGGARKIRLAGRGKGKSGGFRIITFFGGIDIPVFLLSVYAKAQKIDMTQSERNALRIELLGAAMDYRSGTIR